MLLMGKSTINGHVQYLREITRGLYHNYNMLHFPPAIPSGNLTM
jgi:hypothetical protein